MAALLLLGPAGVARAGGAPEGALDTSFSTDGKLLLNVGVTGDYVTAAVLEAPDGALVVVTRRYDGPGMEAWVWFRVAANGAYAACPFTPKGFDELHDRPAAAFDGAGRLVLAGAVADADGAVGGVVRFLYPACVPDPAFGSGGFQVVDPTIAFELITAMAIDPRDPLHRIYLAGVYVAPGIADSLVVSLHEDGSPRIGEFGANGWVRVDTMQLQRTELPIALALQDDGKVLIQGLLAPEFGYPGQTFLQRLTATGARDFDFGAPIDEGAVLLDDTPDDLVGVAMALDRSRRRIVVVGQVVPEEGTGEALLILLDEHGDPDPDFGTGGRRRFEFPGHNSSGLVGVAVDGLGRFVVGGSARVGSGSNYQFAAARLFDDGEFDATFGTGGVVIVPFDVGNPPSDTASAFGMQAGRPVVVGQVFDVDDRHKAGIARLTTALIIADGLEAGGTGAWSSTAAESAAEPRRFPDSSTAEGRAEP